MKEEINLLPPEAKTFRNQRLYLAGAGRIIRRVGGLLILFGMVMLLINGAQRFFHQQLSQTRIQEERLGESPETAARQINRLLGVIHEHSDTHQPVSPHLVSVMKVLPAGTQLTRVTWQINTHAMIVEGVAGTRAEVVDLQKRLEGLSWVERVDAPLRNLASGRGGEFSFTLQRKKTQP
jgi:hypothetical protein